MGTRKGDVVMLRLLRFSFSSHLLSLGRNDLFIP